MELVVAEQPVKCCKTKADLSQIQVYLYLLGFLLAEFHCELELSLFINVHCGRLLESSRND